MPQKNLQFAADRFSGIEGSIFAMSMILELVPENNRRNIFKFDFYALSIDDRTQKSLEWVDLPAYEKASEEIVAYIHKHGISYFENVRDMVAKESDDLLQKSKTVIKEISILDDFALVQAYIRFM